MADEANMSCTTLGRGITVPQERLARKILLRASDEVEDTHARPDLGVNFVVDPNTLESPDSVLIQGDSAGICRDVVFFLQADIVDVGLPKLCREHGARWACAADDHARVFQS